MILDKYGYPVVSIKGQWFKNFLRKCIQGRSIITRKRYDSEYRLRVLDSSVTEPTKD